MIAQITFRPSSTASSYRRCLVRLAFLRKSPTRRTLRPARITLPSHRNSPTTYQRLYPVNATSSSRIRPFSFLRVFRYWLDHALITAFLSLIINLTLPPVQTFRADHFTQISYVRQRMGFTQIFDEASHARSIAAVNRLIEIDGRIAKLSLESVVALLKARRAEKDFFLFRTEFGFKEAKSRYATLVQTNVADISQYMTEIRGLTGNQDVVELTHAVEQGANHYQVEFL